jgi:hypothetical protein
MGALMPRLDNPAPFDNTRLTELGFSPPQAAPFEQEQ